MRTVTRLTRAHQRLRKQLDVLESALWLGAEAWFVLREASFSLSRQLREHIRMEEAALALCRQGPYGDHPMGLAVTLVGHDAARHRLQVASWLLSGEPCFSLEGVRPTVAAAIPTLRASMDRQETELFPLLDRALSAQELDRMPPRISARLTDTMTVEQILRRYPKTRLIFERLLISLPLEQYDSVDEVAWRHGMDCQALLQHLERAIPACYSNIVVVEESIRGRTQGRGH